MVVHYIEFVYPGSFVSTYSSKKIEDRTSKVKLPKGSYGYRFFDREEINQNNEMLKGERKNISHWHFKGEIYDKERVQKEMPNEKILLRNMEGNNLARVLKCHQGFITLDKDDVVI